MERLDLLERQADERVAVAEGVVEEGQGVVLGQGREPQGELRQVDGDLVAVDAVEAVAGDEPAGVDPLVLVGRDGRHGVVGVPGIDQDIAELAAGFDEEGAGAHGRVADLEVEDPFRAGYGPVGLPAQAVQNRFERVADDRFGQLPRRVVGAGLPPLFAGLQDQIALPHEIGGRVAVDRLVQGGVQSLDRRRFAQRLRRLAR